MLKMPGSREASTRWRNGGGEFGSRSPNMRMMACCMSAMSRKSPNVKLGTPSGCRWYQNVPVLWSRRVSSCRNGPIVERASAIEAFRRGACNISKRAESARLAETTWGTPTGLGADEGEATGEAGARRIVVWYSPETTVMNSPTLTATTGHERLNTKFTDPKRIQLPGLTARGRFRSCGWRAKTPVESR